ncbi:lysophospholipid acyltransferase family protein [Nocardia sp. alder85J]|uniref:lysophospholipid acyltransferase family protein n=1 Tax=Nocardia sp. alder85J TaxID=2862949 RepID=UPI001CD3ED68|nr:lysophospholipid acyltransferase family protein [Nocardia sp. alder85J]MCX4094971.1 lysophospholipid acyltransferase family protein [Nocardia sp. alder85J]
MSEHGAVPAGVAEREGEVRLSDGARLRMPLRDADIAALEAVLAPMRAWTSPEFLGFGNIPADGPVMLVGNHNFLGIDTPLLWPEIARTRGRLVRGMAENVLITVPGVRHVLHRIGCVRGTRENCRVLLEQGEMVLVFPGGGREAVPRKGDKYTLDWDGRLGFARLAIETGTPIVPMAMIGADDLFDIVVDGRHPAMWPVRTLVRSLGLKAELTPPLVRGLGLSWIPKPERFYYSAATPIDTTPWRDATDLDAAAAEVQAVVRKALEEELRFLLAHRDRDRGRTLTGRLRQLAGL